MIRVRCFGQLSVQGADGQPIAGAAAQPRRLAILALLARAGDRGMTREKVIGYLWPDSDDERARRLLSQAVYTLRRDLGSEDAIVGVRDLRLGPGIMTSDVGEFQTALDAGAYEAAGMLYAGPFLDGFHLAGINEFDRWLQEERRALDHDADVAFEKCAIAAEARGDHATALAWWRRMAAKDPINARIAIRLMRALVAAGDRDGAIRHAAIHQALVQEQLDLPADADVVRYADQLRAAPSDDPEARLEVPDESDGSDAIRRHAPLPTTAAGMPEPSVPPVKRWRVPLLSTVSVAAVVLIAGVFTESRGRPTTRSPVVVPSRVVVAPLENSTGDSTLDPVGTMVAEWVTQGLLRTGLVQVVDARTMLETARDAGPTRGEDYLHTLAERTAAGTVVSGSYFREGGELRFLTRITGAPSGDVRHTVDVVSAPVSRPTAALEPLRQRITGALAVLLDPRLNNWTAKTSQPPTYEAYSEFLLGMQTFGPDYESSVRHFTRAAQLDSTYWQAMLWDAMSYANLHRYAPADSLFRILDRNRSKLASYDEANLDYFYAGFVRGDWETSYRGARRMLELAPAAGHAIYATGLTAEITNRPREAIDVLTRIDTRVGWGKAWAPRVYNLIARSYHQLGDYRHDLEWAKQLKASEPNVGWTRLEEVKAAAALGQGTEALNLALAGTAFPPSTETWEDYSPGDFLWQAGRELRTHGHAALAREAFERALRWYDSRPPDERATRGHRREVARVLVELGRWADAYDQYRKLWVEDPTAVEHLGAIGVLAARLGRRAEADSIAVRLLGDTSPYAFGAPRLWAARIAAVEGDRNEAVALIHRALREGHTRLYAFHAEQDFDGLRDFPGFREILEPRPAGPVTITASQ